jgi:sugar phosphate isomerase/epimerase
MTAAYLRQLVDAGLDGIEIYHRRLSQEDRTHFLSLANEFGLLVTGGSDAHGWHRGLDELETQPVTEEMLAVLKNRFGRSTSTP